MRDLQIGGVVDGSSLCSTAKITATTDLLKPNVYITDYGFSHFNNHCLSLDGDTI